FTLVARREEAGDALRFAEDVPTLEDWECFARLGRAGLAAYLDCETAWQYGHPGPRLSGTHVLTSTATRLKLLERNWGADPEITGTFAERLARVRHQIHLLRARGFLREGQTRDARAELRLAGKSPLMLRLFSALPGAIVRGLIGLRGLMQSEATQESPEQAG